MNVAMVLVAVVVVVAATAGMMYALYLDGSGVQAAPVPDAGQVPAGPVPGGATGDTDGIIRIESLAHLAGIISASEMDRQAVAFGRSFDEPAAFILEETLSADLMSGEAVQISSAGYSSTNIQVAGVDEPDHVKNDGTYAYVLRDGTLYIVDTGEARVVLRAALDSGPYDIHGMLLSGDRLLVIHGGQAEQFHIPEFGYEPRTRSVPATHALLLDISDRSSPEVVAGIVVDGEYRTARMIGGHAYVVTDLYVDRRGPAFPTVLESGSPVGLDAYYFDTPDVLTTFNTITSIEMEGGSASSETYLMGSAGTFYVSKDHLYLAYPRYGGVEDDPREQFFKVVVPLLPDVLQGEVWALEDAEWSEIAAVLEEGYNRMNGAERDALFEGIRNAMAEYERGAGLDAVRTIIHKVSIDGQDTEYVARGEVRGTLLNQFSMDQSGDKLRVATTTEARVAGVERANAVYVLDAGMDILGGLDGIAPGESIFSARFLGERLYLVTFERIDPFFVIDMSTDTPKVLGELKIPGFSDYLHPYGPDHVIGLGRDAKDEGGWVRELGIKVALFDVSDVSDPKLAGEVIIGDEQARSEALWDHRAFYFEDGAISIPVITYPGGVEGAWEDGAWGGFYVLDVGPGGIEQKGTIPHASLDPYVHSDGWRTLHIGDALYTISHERIKINDRTDLEEIGEVRLGGSGGLIRYLE